MPVLTVVVMGVVTMGCSTVVRPTKPDTPLTAIGPAVEELRFDGEETILREPGMPLSPSRAWQREVQNYTATSLNTLMTTAETAPNARTVVSFDMASPSVIQIGTWKEIDIVMTSTLPDGTVVKSAPVVGHIDDPLEYAAMTGASVGGTVLNAIGTIAIILFFFDGAQSRELGLVAIGSLVGGILLSVGQSVGQYFVASNEEKRWSNLYATALTAHAADVRKALAGPRRPAPVKPPVETKPPPPTPRDPSDPSDADVPPLLEK